MKRIALVLVALIVTVAFAACGETTTTTVTEDPASSQTEAAVETDADIVDPDPNDAIDVPQEQPGWTTLMKNAFIDGCGTGNFCREALDYITENYTPTEAMKLTPNEIIDISAEVMTN